VTPGLPVPPRAVTVAGVLAALWLVAARLVVTCSVLAPCPVTVVATVDGVLSRVAAAAGSVGGRCPGPADGASLGPGHRDTLEHVRDDGLALGPADAGVGSQDEPVGEHRLDDALDVVGNQVVAAVEDRPGASGLEQPLDPPG